MPTKTFQKKSNFAYTLLLLIAFFPSTLFAQTRPTVNIDIIPENYTAGEEITLTVSSFNVSLDSANIEWQVSGETFKQGSGVTQIRIQAPESGEVAEVRVLVTQRDQRVEETIILRPETVDMYVESLDGYTPVWYLGRSQVAEESVVKIIAVPDSFKAINGDTARVYLWSKDNFNDVRQSGLGKQAFITKLSPFVNSEDISVEVGNTSNTVTVEPSPTRISLYEYSPLVGTRFEKELTGKLNLTREDVTFEVVPWFFSIPNRTSRAMSLSWSVNGLPTRAQANNAFLNLRKGSSKRGQSEVGVRAQHKERSLQSNTISLTIDL